MTYWTNDGRVINSGPKGRKVRAKVCQVRDNYVLCATNEKGYPWGSISGEPKHLHLEAEWKSQGLLPYSVVREVPEDYSLQLQLEHSDYELGGSSNSQSEEVPDLAEDLRPDEMGILTTRFNFFYNAETGAIESPDSVWKSFDHDLKYQEMQKLTPAQLEFVVGHCQSYASKDEFYQSLKGSSLSIILPNDIRSVPNKANSKTTECGRIIQRKIAPGDSEFLWVGTTLGEVLKEIHPSEQVDT